MKTSSILSGLLLLTFASSACAQGDAATKPMAKPESMHDRASYAIGLNLGENLRTQEVPANLDYLIQGLRDGLGDSAKLLSDDELKETMQAFQQEMAEKRKETQAAAGAKNKNEAEEFLAQNKTKPGVKTTASGLQYEVITPGTGPKPTAQDKVTVNYKGTLLSGKQFDSSYDRGQPATFPVSGVIPGWVEALQLMPVGSKYKLYIPPELAYGERGAGPVIGPNSLLVFEVELLSIADKDAEKPAPAKPAPPK
jgi:FKBP-type peptidyl-prolyl cis-trans isomerase FklB